MSTTSPPTRVLGGVTVPDTPLITKAIALAQANISREAFNHVMRSWLFGHHIATHVSDLKSANIDSELHAVTAILHDLGWSTSSEFISPDKRFEVDGANATRAFLVRETSWDKRRLQLAWDAVALHTSASIALYKEAEVKACCLGIHADFVGWQGAYGGVLTKDVWDGIVGAYPRDGFGKSVVEALCGLCRTKPETTYDNFVSDFGEEYVEGYSVVGKRLVDAVKVMKD